MGQKDPGVGPEGPKCARNLLASPTPPTLAEERRVAGVGLRELFERTVQEGRPFRLHRVEVQGPGKTLDQAVDILVDSTKAVLG